MKLFLTYDLRTISSTFLRSPRLIAKTSPLAGAVNRISGLFLSKNNGSPALTSWPALTSIFGESPGKSVGLSASLSASNEVSRTFTATPLKGISNPRFKWICFGMILSRVVMYKLLKVKKTNTFHNLCNLNISNWNIGSGSNVKCYKLLSGFCEYLQINL